MKKLNKHIKTPINKRKNAGFTLLELVVVVAVMGLISSMAMDVYTDNTNQKRFELTKQRLAEIKFAIIGDSSRDLITGYVVDVGELPLSIDELLYQCVTNSTYPEGVEEYNELNCGTNKWIENWNGPYLRNRQTDEDGNYVFKDGWGNNFEFSSDGSEVITYSLGLDRTRNPSNTADYNKQISYERDYPRSDSSNPSNNPFPLITENEYKSALIEGPIVEATISIKVSADVDLYKCLAIKTPNATDYYVSEPVKIKLLSTDSAEDFNFNRLKNIATSELLEKSVNTYGNNEYLIIDSTSSLCSSVNYSDWTDTPDWNITPYVEIKRRDKSGFIDCNYTTGTSRFCS